MFAIIKFSYHTKVLDMSSTYHSSAADGAISLLSLLNIFFSFMKQNSFPFAFSYESGALLVGERREVYMFAMSHLLLLFSCT